MFFNDFTTRGRLIMAGSAGLGTAAGVLGAGVAAGKGKEAGAFTGVVAGGALAALGGFGFALAERSGHAKAMVLGWSLLVGGASLALGSVAAGVAELLD